MPLEGPPSPLLRARTRSRRFTPPSLRSRTDRFVAMPRTFQPLQRYSRACGLSPRSSLRNFRKASPEALLSICSAGAWRGIAHHGSIILHCTNRRHYLDVAQRAVGVRVFQVLTHAARVVVSARADIEVPLQQQTGVLAYVPHRSDAEGSDLENIRKKLMPRLNGRGTNFASCGAISTPVASNGAQ